MNLKAPTLGMVFIVASFETNGIGLNRINTPAENTRTNLMAFYFTWKHRK